MVSPCQPFDVATPLFALSSDQQESSNSSGGQQHQWISPAMRTTSIGFQVPLPPRIVHHCPGPQPELTNHRPPELAPALLVDPAIVSKKIRSTQQQQQHQELAGGQL